MSLSRRQAGYSLIELMIVVTIIGVSVVAFTPGFKLAMIQREASAATRDMVRLGRRAMSEASMGAAHLVWIDPNGGTDGAPRYQLLRGQHRQLHRSGLGHHPGHVWRSLPACLEPALASRRAPTAVLSTWTTAATTTSWATGVELQITPTASQAICYTPRGSVFTASGAAMPASSALQQNIVGGGLLFTLVVRRTADSVSLGPPRNVLFASGSSPRVLR